MNATNITRKEAGMTLTFFSQKFKILLEANLVFTWLLYYIKISSEKNKAIPG